MFCKFIEYYISTIDYFKCFGVPKFVFQDFVRSIYEEDTLPWSWLEILTFILRYKCVSLASKDPQLPILGFLNSPKFLWILYPRGLLRDMFMMCTALSGALAKKHLLSLDCCSITTTCLGLSNLFTIPFCLGLCGVVYCLRLPCCW